MAIFREASADARQRLVKTSKGYQQRQSYRENLGKLTEGRYLEVEAEPGESTRKVKVNLRRAANELGINIGYGDTQENSVLVWLEPARERRSGRGRPRRNPDGG